jgi:hypothetical protein
MPSPAELNESTPLAVLALQIRRLDDALRAHTRNALRVALDEGDLLTQAKARVEPRRWKPWRTETCPNLTERTDVLYRRLAAFRARIEQELAVNPDLSIREAVKLISVPRPRPPRLKPAALEKWQALSADEKREGLQADGIDALLEYLPGGLREQVADRVARIKHKTAKDRALSARLRDHIKDHPDDQLAKYVRAQAIDLKNIVVHVGAIDAPSNRRPPLVSSGSVH